MSVGIHHRHHFGVLCQVPGCTDFVRVRKHGLCATHYCRWRDTGGTDVLSATRDCAECGRSMVLVGAKAKTQRFCSDKCRLVEKRRRENAREGYRALAASYKYAWKLKTNYGITRADYQRLYEAQVGLCAICFKSELEIGERLCVDHDHATGLVRGLLCRKCNKAIGGFDESTDRIERAIDYLKTPTANAVGGELTTT